ncbi:MAG: hypothetical protein U0T75_13845 [Chitinophagales bacterium]
MKRKTLINNRFYNAVIRKCTRFLQAGIVGIIIALFVDKDAAVKDY